MEGAAIKLERLDLELDDLLGVLLIIETVAEQGSRSCGGYA